VEFSRSFGSAMIGPLGGSCSISAIHFTANRVSPTSKEDPLADYIVGGGQLRKLDDALQGSVFIRRSTTTKRATGTIAFSSVESAPTLHFGLDSWRGRSDEWWRPETP